MTTMNNAPEWMKQHLGSPGIRGTVSYTQTRIKNYLNSESAANDILSKRMSAEDLMVLYATPIVINVQCSKVIGLLRQQLIRSRIVEDLKPGEKRMTEYIKIAQDSLEDELTRLRTHGDVDLHNWLVEFCDDWFSKDAIGLITTWRNAFSSILMKKRYCNHNDNLHEFLCFALAARAIAHEAVDCECDIREVLTKKLEGSGLVFNLHGDSATTKLMTATNVICDRFSLPTYEETMEDLNVRRCQDNWVRKVGSVMASVKSSTTTKK